MTLKLVGFATLLGLVGLLLFTLLPFAAANVDELFGHNNAGRIYKIDTSDGSGIALPFATGNGSVASGMATSRGPVSAPGGVVYAAGTHFGLLADEVVVIDTVTGVATPVVTTSRSIGGRGIAFGPDGVTLYMIEGNAELSTIDTVTGLVTKVGDVEDLVRNYPSAALEFDPDPNTFYALSRGTVVNVDPSDGSAIIVGALNDLGYTPCTLARSPNGTWFTRRGNSLVTIDITNGTEDLNIGGTGMTGVCGTAFAPERPLTIVVDIDIKPGSDPNAINCNNQGEVIPVAILTTDDFDATTVDHTTVTFEGASETHVDKKTGEPRRHEEDVDDDGDIDLGFHFQIQISGTFTCSSTAGTLVGETFDGQSIEGTDAVLMVLGRRTSIFVDEETGGTLTFPKVRGFSITVLPGSSTFPDGEKSGKLHLRDVVVETSVVIVETGGTIQEGVWATFTMLPSGVRFDPPASVVFPNLTGLAPGTVTEMFSFHHDIGQFVNIGPGTVSKDGSVVVSDPGFGIVQSG